MENVLKGISEIPENFKSFILEHNDNAFLWIGLFFGGLLVFWLTYNALHKNDQ